VSNILPSTKAGQLATQCAERHALAENGQSATTGCGQRCRTCKLVSILLAERTVNWLACARMSRCRQVRWSLQSVQCVLQVKAVVMTGASATKQSSSRRGVAGFRRSDTVSRTDRIKPPLRRASIVNA
jgi:hypothetical protein